MVKAPSRGKHPESGSLSAKRANGFAVSRDLSAKLIAVADLKPLGRQTRKHPVSQIKKLARSLAEWGFVLPIVTDEHGRVVAGWALVQAATRLGEAEVPAVTVTDLNEVQLRSLRQALNRLGEDSGWDPKELALEFSDILHLDPDVNLTLTGFEMGEIDLIFRGTENDAGDEADDYPEPDRTAPAITQPGDLWTVDGHRLLCADATQAETFVRLMSGELAEMIFTDPPYNVPIGGHVSGLGATQHTEFAMASGEMSEAEYTKFLETAFGLMCAHSKDGSVHYVCMDWRHLPELLRAGRKAYGRPINLCVWVKTNAGMGSLYRSRHEFVAVFKTGGAPNINNVMLGKFGRCRTNVWEYAGMNSFGAGRDELLALHPTVKPVALVRDAILDVSNRGGIVLDPFLGSGTTLIAAERAGRRCFGLEIDPHYVDVALRRYGDLTGQMPVNAGNGLSFEELERTRS